MQSVTRCTCVPVLLAALCSPLGASAQTAPTAPLPQDAVNLAPVAVSGVLPGPALWKVSKNGHVLWVLGTISPLPRHMQWDSSKIDRLTASSQEVLRAPRLGVGVAGFWGMFSMIPAMIGLKKLPHGQTLQHVLPPPLYAQWLVQKAQYLPGLHGWGVDRLRPLFAARKLYDAAIDQSGLVNGDVVGIAVYAAAKHAKVRITSTDYNFVTTNPHRLASRFKKSPMNDQQCLRQMVHAVGQHFPQATARANAWATGDLPALGKILSVKQHDACMTALGNSPFAKSVGLADLPQQMEQVWLKAAQAALAHDTQAVAVLPMSEVMASDGYLSALAKDGYTVQSPAARAAASTTP
ncbi:MAG: TraB/GumN family protein [Rhodanobacter sp.]